MLIASPFPIKLTDAQARTRALSQLCHVCSAPHVDHLIPFPYRNHPVIKEDGLLNVFLIEPSFEEWRKRSSISLDEESVSKRIDRVEEMAIPSDLEEKIAYVRSCYTIIPQLLLRIVSSVAK